MSGNLKRIYLSNPHLSGEEQSYIQQALASNWIAPLGPHVDAFEQELAEYVGIKGTLALSCGTAAIHLALRLAGVGPGDLVFCSSLTFAASAYAVLYQGAEPIFIDSEEASWNMSPKALNKAFQETEREGSIPKAVIVVNLYGQSADLEPLLEICDYHGVPVIEDAAESLGAVYRGRASGTFGKFGIYSFNGNKIITTSGGGMLVSQDLDALGKARYWATQARDPAIHYQHSELGYNYRLSNILAAIGRAQLKVLDDRIRARRLVFQRYQEALSHLLAVSFMPELPHGRSTRWLTALTIDGKACRVSLAAIIEAMEKENIEVRPVWKPMHLQPFFKGCRYYPHSNTESVSDKLFERGICLPSGSSLTEAEQDRVIACLQKLLCA